MGKYGTILMKTCGVQKLARENRFSFSNRIWVHPVKLTSSRLRFQQRKLIHKIERMELAAAQYSNSWLLRRLQEWIRHVCGGREGGSYLLRSENGTSIFGAVRL